MLASLNHPNIAQIHGIEKSDDTQALVLELVEGPTLADRIATGPIPLDEALPIAKQIAEALEAAHEAGVIHRDLKPANIKVREDGTVKVLDFGLAKALDTTPEGDPDESPTLTAVATRAGVILGTAAYMSPEQAKGRPVDKRTDIWAFGAVLFEMLTGKRAFGRGDVAETLARVIEREPDFDVLPARTPEPIRRLVRRCLAKDRKRRLPDIGAARLELDEAMTGSPEVTSAATGEPPVWQRTQPLVAGVSVAVGLVVGLSVWSATRPAAPLVSQFTILSPSEDPGSSGDVLSPDGRTLAFSANHLRSEAGATVYIRRLDEREPVPLGGAEGTTPIAFSPDGQSLLVADASMLKRVPLDGGPTIVVADRTNRAEGRGADWGPGDIIVAGSRDGLWTVSASGGEFQRLETAADSEDATMPRFLPSGRAVLFHTGSRDDRHVAAYDLDTGQRHTLLRGTTPQFAPSGHLIFYRDGSLWAAPFDPGRLEVSGEPRPVVEGVGANNVGLAFYSVAQDGTLTYRPRGGGGTGGGQLVWVHLDSREEPLPHPLANYNWPRLSPDGRSMVVTIHGENTDLWISELGRGPLSKLTTAAGYDQYSLWPLDSEQVVFMSGREGQGPWDLYQKNIDGTRPVEKLLTREGRGGFRPQAWSPDNAGIVFDHASPSGVVTASDIGVLRIDDMTSEWLLQTEANEWAPTLSPNGAWIAYVSDETGQPEVYVDRFPELGDRQRVSAAGGSQPLWSPDGRELFYGEGGQRMMAVSIDEGTRLTLGAPMLLFEGPYVFSPNYTSYDIHPDGNRFLMIKRAADALHPVSVVLNWAEELKRLVPAN